jgi:hypothetical protein
MPINLLAEFNANMPEKYHAALLEIDPSRIAKAMAEAMAADMADNLYNGVRPDGAGPMPTGKTTGKPRGQGRDISRAIKAIPREDGGFVIASTEEDDKGTLGRILKGIPFRPPEDSKRQRDVRDRAAEISEVPKK